MATATVALVLATAFAEPLSRLLQLGDEPDLVRAAAVGLWAQMNYTQLTVVLRAEERSVQFMLATLANVLVTIAATVLLVVVLEKGPLGALIGVFAGTLAVYAVLLVRRRADLGFELDRPLLRAMNRFGAPLIPAALGLWAISFADRWFIAVLDDQSEVGVYSVAVRVASAVLFLQLAFRRAWPTFAYSIEDDREARTAYARVLTYVVLATSWVALGLTLLGSVARPAAHERARVLPRRRCRRPARVQRRCLRRLQRHLDRLGPRRRERRATGSWPGSGLSSTSPCASR